MKLQFDASQDYQQEAIRAVVDLFAGQPLAETDYEVTTGAATGHMFRASNQLLLPPERLAENLRGVQLRNEIEFKSAAAVEGWQISQDDGSIRLCPHFSIEMETGTGKTYVYLRTVYELCIQYGFRKFIIVVPGVAIREGVLKNIEITADHFAELYNNLVSEHFVYDSKKINRLRQFATGNQLQILIINIDAFRKNFMGTDEELKSNIIYRESDRLSGWKPIDFIRSTNPVVIIDEPQSVDGTEKSQEAIRALNPLLTLRYSATHRNPYNLVYRLDPVRAFQLGLVKQIVVAGAHADGTGNAAFVKVEKIDRRKRIQAKLRIHVQTDKGIKEKAVTVTDGSDLYALSDERAHYRDGYIIAEITGEPGNEHIRFQNKIVVRVGEEIGGIRDDLWRAQIRHTIRKHLDRELLLSGLGIKVLSLFFIDRVANYRDYDDSGAPRKGMFALECEAALREFSQDQRYDKLAWLKNEPDALHNGYFSQDKKGILKDTRGDSQADDDTYSLIMRDKEKLLSIETPLRFIFSHSALREGWDNPNVFQICTLNQTQTTMKKRQEIGRGLRLPVNQNGERIFDPNINRLYVFANESYEDFARALQAEYEVDCGVTFGRVPITALARLTCIVGDEEVHLGMDRATRLHAELIEKGMLDAGGRILPAFKPADPNFQLELSADFEQIASETVDLLANYQMERHIKKNQEPIPNPLRKEVQLSPEFKALWDRIKPKTTYRVEFSTEDLVREVLKNLKALPKIEPARIQIASGRLEVRESGINLQAESAAVETVDFRGPIPDILAYLQNTTELTRSTLTRILIESGRLAEFFGNPQRYLDAFTDIIKFTLRRLIVDGIKYEKLTGPDSEWEMREFQNAELFDYLNVIRVRHSLYTHIVLDSMVERRFAEQLDQRSDIKLFVKLPKWFQVETPLGPYNPDWGIVKENDKTLYLVRETKGSKDFLKAMRGSEAAKVLCGKQHFESIGVDFEVVISASEI